MRFHVDLSQKRTKNNKEFEFSFKFLNAFNWPGIHEILPSKTKAKCKSVVS